MSVNNIVLEGYLGSEPELLFSQSSGKGILKFRIAVNQYNGRDREATTGWWNVVLFGSSAEKRFQWLHKGTRVLVEGQLRAEEYLSKDGTKKTSIKIHARQVCPLTAKSETHPRIEGPGEAFKQKAEEAEEVEEQNKSESLINDEDIPF